jgi:multidrug efflux system outer membrane protein
MIPEYVRPEPPVPPAWPEATAPAGSPPEAVPAGPPAAEIGWQDYFTDPRLRSVIELALANNRDLRIAALNVDRMSALYRIQRAELYPGVGVLASGEAVRLPGNMSGTGRAETAEQYAVQVGTLSWEIDFFGRIRSLNAAALEQYLATEEARRAAQISLVAGTASAWLALAADAESLQIAQSTLDAQLATLELLRQSSDLGMASDLEVRQAESQVELARAAVARFTGFVAVDRNALDVLAGTTVPADLLPGELTTVTGIAGLSPGLPSDVLLGRPDILVAEHRLKAANANIGAARAAFFPNITLTAGAGTRSPDLSGLFKAGSGTWSFVPQIVAPIFASGSIRANLEATKVEREIAVALYEKSIQNAFREVSDGLALRTTLAAQQEAETALVMALEEAFRLSNARYEAGMDGYLLVLVAQRSLFAAQEALVNVRLAEQVNLVTLYKALGGGG